MELLARRDIKRLVQVCSTTDALVREAIALIARLEPKPGRRFVDVERNIVVPDVLVRAGIRHLLAGTIKEHTRPDVAAQKAALLDYIADLKTRGIAEQTQAANVQHYEVPTVFYQRCLGKRLKYSSGLWLETTTTLDEAEENMLALTCQRAELADGQRILEMGCGWGSLSLWMAPVDISTKGYWGMGIVLLIDNSRPDPLGDLDVYLDGFAGELQSMASVVGVGRHESHPEPGIDAFVQRLEARGLMLPVLPVDVRQRDDVLLLIDTLLVQVESGLQEVVP